jgi:hypothetical protein
MLDFIDQEARQPDTQTASLVAGLSNRLSHSTQTNRALASAALESVSSDANIQLLRDAYSDINSALESIAQDLQIEPTHAQRRAAAMAGILATDYRGFMAKGFKAPASMEMGVAVEAHGLPDMVEGRSFSLEAYDERENKNASIYSITYNMQSARQDDFGEAFFPTITMSADQAGFGVHVNLMLVYDGVIHKITGDVEDFKRKNIIRAVADHSIMRKDQTRAVPVYRPQNASHFVDPALVAPVSFDLDGIEFQTAPLKVGMEHGLIPLSGHDELLAGGAMTETDSLDPAVSLTHVYAKVGDDVLKFDVRNQPLSNFVRGPQNNYRVQLLNFETTSLLLNKGAKTAAGDALTDAALKLIDTHDLIVRVKMVMSGTVNIETGAFSVYGNSINVYSVQDSTGQFLSLESGHGKDIADAFAAGSILGVDQLSYRSNANRRQRGQLIDTQQYTQMYLVPLRSPITAQHPINTDASVDAADVQALVTATRIRVGNEAVTALIDAANMLDQYVDARDTQGVGPDVLGVGRFFVRPTFFKETIDMAVAIDSLTSTARRSDIEAVLINKIRDYAARMYRDSEYKAAADALCGGQSPMPTLNIGTDPVLASYLQVTGDLRTAGSQFDFKIVSTLDRRVAGHIFLTFGVYDANRNITVNPLNFGNMVWAPELVLTAQISRGNTISRETVVQPRYLFITNLPVMTVLTVKGVQEVLNKVPVLISER